MTLKALPCLLLVSISPAQADCYTQCLANGPDDSPMTKTDWPKKSKVDKENDCSAACADEGMPVEHEEKMNKP